ncbi:MAG TPA: GTPase Era [Solirubrobacteraceae bacterium]|nr:GTPase Era [Solirubrobacteraceae bacterium]
MSRAGFVALAGRPNVGKSTLTNAIVGTKVAIVSDRPQTTRRAIRGLAHGPDWQLVLVDLPGVQRPRDALTSRMQGSVVREVADADAALLMLNGQEGVGPGDRYIAQALMGAHVPITIAVNKMDRLKPDRQAQALIDAAELVTGAAEIFPVSARTGAGVQQLVDHLVGLLPVGPFLYETDKDSDIPLEEMLAELIREQVLRRTFQEVPHSVGVVLETLEFVHDDLHRVRALVWVETESQKGILIGSGARMIKAIGTAARKELERMLATRVHLDLSVRVRRHWRTDDGLLDRLGIDRI